MARVPKLIQEWEGGRVEFGFQQMFLCNMSYSMSDTSCKHPAYTVYIIETYGMALHRACHTAMAASMDGDRLHGEVGMLQ